MVSEDDIWLWLNKLSTAMDPMAVAMAVAEVGADAADASSANLAMLDSETDWVRVCHGSPVDAGITAHWSEFPLSAQSPLCEAMQTGQPVLLGSPEVIGERYPILFADIPTTSLHATASLPLRAASGAILGRDRVRVEEPQTFDERQVARLGLVARVASQALERTQLYERESGDAVEADSVVGAGGDQASDRLTRREIAVLQLLSVGYTNAEIANLLGVSLRTVESTRSALRRNLGLRTPPNSYGMRVMQDSPTRATDSKSGYIAPASPAPKSPEGPRRARQHDDPVRPLRNASTGPAIRNHPRWSPL